LSILGAGEVALTREIRVGGDHVFTVEREAATRLYPAGSSPMMIKVTAHEDFVGNLIETLPESFEIGKIKVTVQGLGSVGDAEVIDSGNGIQQIYVHDLNLVAGDVLLFGYEYDAPDVSPDFFVISPLQFVGTYVGTIYEGRSWQIVNDNPVEVDDANLVGWWSADKNAYSDAAGTVPAVSCATGASCVQATNGVYTWNDASALANTVQQSTSGDRPTYRDGTTTEAINFHPTLDFDGTDYIWKSNTIWPTATSAGTVFMVGKNDTLSSSYDSAIELGNDTLILGTLNERPVTYSNVSTPNPIYGYPMNIAGAGRLQSWDWTGGTDSTLNMRTNGNNTVSTVFDATSMNTSNFHIGGGNTDLWLGTMAEMIVYKEVLSQSNREKIESYLAIKYGITLSQQGTNFASNAYYNTTTSQTNTGSIGQVFAATATGTINTVTFSVDTSNTATSATVYLCDATVSALASTCISGNPGVGKVNQTVTLPANPSVDTTVTVQFDTPLAATSGTNYVFHVKPAANTLVLDVDTTNNHYAGGSQYTGDTNNTTQDVDFSVDGFRTGGRDYVASRMAMWFLMHQIVSTPPANSSSVINNNIASTSSVMTMCTIFLPLQKTT
jgi:hypothetical protein